jgi:hypothetical protein
MPDADNDARTLSAAQIDQFVQDGFELRQPGATF